MELGASILQPRSPELLLEAPGSALAAVGMGMVMEGSRGLPEHHRPTSDPPLHWCNRVQMALRHPKRSLGSRVNHVQVQRCVL